MVFGQPMLTDQLASGPRSLRDIRKKGKMSSSLKVEICVTISHSIPGGGGEELDLLLRFY